VVKLKHIKGVLDRKRGKRISNFEQENSAAVYFGGAVESKLDQAWATTPWRSTLSTMKIYPPAAQR
jgi:hypothetical protein